jgi:hypothetical protein
MISPWYEQDWQCIGLEANILNILGLHHTNTLQSLNAISSSLPPEKWEPPPIGFIKLNFDNMPQRETQGHLVQWDFRNEQGDILWIYVDNIGMDNNNVVELQSLERGLLISIREGYNKLVVEGDSHVIIWDS